MAAVMEALEYPAEKKFQQFVGLTEEDFVHPSDRGPDYTIIEIATFEGRSDQAKRQLIAQLFARIKAEVGTDPHSVEITIMETPKANSGIRGMNAAGLSLGYRVDV